MQAYVYTSKSLERQAGRFVWLSINTEDAKNADFLSQYKVNALPTLFVLDPKREAVLMRYVGGANVKQLSTMLDDARAKSAGAEDALLASADKLAAEGSQDEAAKLYASALEKAPKGWKRRTRAAESLVVALALSGNNEECAARAMGLLGSTRGTVSGANIAATGLGCASELDAKFARRAEMIDALEKGSRSALADPKLDISDDDRSGIYIALIGSRDAAEDKEGSRKLKQEWVAFLESAAAAAKTPKQRSVYDSHRLTAYMELDTPEKAIPMLEQSERDFPDDYNPPARLALAYKAMKKYDEALVASDRALAHAYGPRKITILRARADIYTGMGDKAAAKKTIDEAIAYAKSLPSAQRNPRTIAALEKKSAELSN
jgi:tetratricopeptide (TPR) repeat protein